MSLNGTPVFNENERTSFFNYKSEEARPYYYRAYLSDYDIRIEIVSTERAAMLRFTFPESKGSYVVVDACDRGSFVQILPSENKIVGYTPLMGAVPLPCFVARSLLSLLFSFRATDYHPGGRTMFSTSCAVSNSGAMSSSLKPAMPHPMRVTRKVSSLCALAKAMKSST